MSSNSIETRALALMSEALDQPSGQRTAWVKAACQGDTVLANRVLALLETDARSGGSILRTGGAGQDILEAPVPERIGPYRILEQVGRGGMGAVYKATRDVENFDHIVAIKIIRQGAMSETLIERFQRERQILANLNHPNIARLYDGGETEDGAPYIVMEHIDGQPLGEWVNDRKLSPDDRLWLFRDLCSAVRHAHQNLIIHRDLTPSNVLVTQTGAVKLIDFGIAKPQAESEINPQISDAASLANLSFTPGFAAPERSAGSPPNTLSDIFSLGKLLEDMIGGAARNPDLQAIINTCTSTRPQDRYSSVDGLITDLDSLRTHFPINARAGGPIYRFRKFLRRRRLSILAASVFVIGLSAALAGALVQYQRAETARVEADQRFNETRALTSFLLEDLTRDLNKLPGALPLMRTVGDVSASYLDILSDAATADDSVKFDYAMGRARLAEVLTQGGGANLGQPEKGIENFEESLRVLEELASQDGASTNILAELATTRTDYGYAIAYHFGEWERGMAINTASLPLHDQVVAADPTNAQWVLNQLRAQYISAYAKLGDDDAFFSAMSEVRERYAVALEMFPEHPRIKPDLTSFLRIMANAQLDRWDGTESETVPSSERALYDQALQDIERSVDLASELISIEPSNPEHYYQYVWSQEIQSLLLSMRLEWVTTIDTLMGNLASAGNVLDAESFRQTIMARPDYEQRLEVYADMSANLDQSDSYLRQLDMFDGETFSHYEAVYYNLEARAYLALQIKFDIEEGLQYLEETIQFADQFTQQTPDERIWHYEGAEARLEKAYILLLKQPVMADDTTPEICALVQDAIARWSSAQSRWDDEIYAYTFELGSALAEAAECTLSSPTHE